MSLQYKRGDEKRPSITEVLEEVDHLVTEEATNQPRKFRRSFSSSSQGSHRDRAVVTPEGNSTTREPHVSDENPENKRLYDNERKRVSLSLLSPFNKFSPQSRRQAKMISGDEQKLIEKGPPLTPYQLKMQRLGAVLNTLWFQVTLMLATFLALYGPDINMAVFNSDADIYMAWLCVVITVVFVVEIAIQILIPEPYFLTFYFFLDLVGTLSLIPDMVMLFSPRLQANADALTFAKAGRIVRVGTRSTQAVRLFKLVRIARIMRVFKIRFFSVLFNSKTPKGQEASKPHKLGLHLADQLGKRVIIGTITLMFVIPNLEVVVTDRSPTHGLTMIELQSNVSGWNSTACKSTVGEYIAQHNDSMVWLEVKGDSPPEKNKSASQVQFYRQSAVVLYETETHLSKALFSLEDEKREEALYNMILTTFIVALLGYSAFKFNEDVRSNVVEPIERTTRVIRKLATTLFVLSHEELNDEEIDLMESRFIERVVDQLNTFFSVDSKARKSTVVKVSPGIEETADIIPASPEMSGKVKEMLNSIPDERISELGSLDALWKDQQGLQYFKVFLTSEFALESFSFLKAVEEYGEAWSNIERAVGEIIKNYVDERSLFQVNISAKEREEILETYKDKKLRSDLFQKSFHEIFVQLEKDNFQRFVKSDLAKQLRALKKKKTKEYKLLGGPLIEQEEKNQSRRGSSLVGWPLQKKSSLTSISEMHES